MRIFYVINNNHQIQQLRLADMASDQVNSRLFMSNQSPTQI